MVEKRVRKRSLKNFQFSGDGGGAGGGAGGGGSPERTGEYSVKF